MICSFVFCDQFNLERSRDYYRTKTLWYVENYYTSILILISINLTMFSLTKEVLKGDQWSGK